MSLVKIKQIEGLTGDLSALTSADLSLATKISTDIAASNLDLTGDIDTVADGLSTELIVRAAADSAISTNLSAEVVRAEKAENTLATDLSAELVDRAAADGALDTAYKAADTVLDGKISDNASAIAAEESRATGAEGVLQGNINSEAATRLANDNTLQGSIDGVASDLSSYETSNNGALAAEKAARILADSGLSGRVEDLENAILEDNEMFVESFAGNGFEYDVAKFVQDDNAKLVTAFVNGQNVSVFSANGVRIVLSDPGYIIDKDDTVTITYQA